MNAARFFADADGLVASHICALLDDTSLVAVAPSIRSLRHEACARLEARTVETLQCEDEEERERAVRRLRKLGSERLSRHVAALLRGIHGDNEDARKAAFLALGVLDDAARDQHLPEFLAKMLPNYRCTWS